LFRRIHIVGRKNHGKTGVLTELVRELTELGLAVGTIKHTGHAHDIDTPESDSHRHYEAGGAPAAIISKEVIGAFLPRDDDADPYEMLAPLYADVDLVLVEGQRGTPNPTFEVWRAELDQAPMALEDESIRLLITDDEPPDGICCPTTGRSQLAELASALSALLEMRTR